MQRIDTITVNHQGAERSVILCVGDLSLIPQHEAVDVLVVSAFPNDYHATCDSLIGSLARHGILVGRLAQEKEVDLRHFSQRKRLHTTPTTEEASPFRYDVFVSYCQKNKDEIDSLVATLRVWRPSLRVFMDRLELRPGAAWQQHIFDALDASRKIICAFSPDYLSSKVCKEEFNIALFRHWETKEGVLLPVYLYSAELPTYMKMLHYEDVREGDPEKIVRAAKNLLAQI